MSNVSCEPSIPLEARVVPAEQAMPLNRHIEMDEVRNLRDMGGYKTEDGKELAWGKIYRSASLYEATQTDIDFLVNRLGIKQLIDFRNPSETDVEPEPEALIQQLEYHWVSILVLGTARQDLVDRLKNSKPGEDFSEILVEANQNLVLHHHVEIKQWFDLLLEKEGPFLFHCTEGKDRTGFAAAMLLSALGVDRKTIMKDYMLTNKVNQLSIEERIKKSRVLSAFQVNTEQLRQLLMVHEDYLGAAFDVIESEYGSVHAFLEKAYDLTPDKIEKLKARFLQ